MCQDSTSLIFLVSVVAYRHCTLRQAIWSCREIASCLLVTCDTYELQGQVQQAIVTGQPVDISRMAEFGFYDWDYYRYDNMASFSYEKQILGRYLEALLWI